MGSDVSFDLSSVFRTVAQTLPDREALIWRDQRWTYAQLDARIDGVAHYLVSQGLGCHVERDQLAPHESGQDHLGLYLRNGNQYLEAMVAGYRARVAPFNVNYRYVEEELLYLLTNSAAKALVYGAEFAPFVASIRDRLPELRVLIQVADASGNELLPGAVDYESIVATPAPAGGMPSPSGDDLYILYTGGTTGMPKGVLWRQHDIFMSAMGGRPFGSDTSLASYEELAEQARAGAGVRSILMIPPLMHGAAQWAAFNMFSTGGWMVLPDDVDRPNAPEVMRLAERERVLSIPVVGDAIARPLLDEIETVQVRPVRPADDHQRRCAAVADGAGAPAGRAAQPDGARRGRCVRDRHADDHRGGQGRRAAGRDLHSAARHRHHLGGFQHRVGGRRRRGLAGPAGLCAAGVFG